MVSAMASGIRCHRLDSVYKSIYDVYHTVSDRTGKIGTVKVNRLFAFYQTVKALGFENVKSMATGNKSQFNRNLYR